MQQPISLEFHKQLHTKTQVPEAELYELARRENPPYPPEIAAKIKSVSILAQSQYKIAINLINSLKQTGHKLEVINESFLASAKELLIYGRFDPLKQFPDKVLPDFSQLKPGQKVSLIRFGAVNVLIRLGILANSHDDPCARQNLEQLHNDFAAKDTSMSVRLSRTREWLVLQEALEAAKTTGSSKIAVVYGAAHNFSEIAERCFPGKFNITVIETEHSTAVLSSLPSFQLRPRESFNCDELESLAKRWGFFSPPKTPLNDPLLALKTLLEEMGLPSLVSAAACGSCLLMHDVLLQQGYSPNAAKWGTTLVMQAWNLGFTLKALAQGVDKVAAFLPWVTSSLLHQALKKAGAGEKTQALCSTALAAGIASTTGAEGYRIVAQLVANFLVNKFITMGESAFANRYLTTGLKAQLKLLNTQHAQLLSQYQPPAVKGKKTQPSISDPAPKQIAEFSGKIAGLQKQIKAKPSMEHYARVHQLRAEIEALTTAKSQLEAVGSKKLS